MDKKERFIRKRLLVYLAKNKDYGSSFDKSLDKFGEVAYEVRAYDKINRFKQLIGNENEVKDESIRDTVLDLWNYSIMFIMWGDCRNSRGVRLFIDICEEFMEDNFQVFLNKIGYLVEDGETVKEMRKLLLNELG